MPEKGPHGLSWLASKVGMNAMKVLTAAEMGVVDRRTAAEGGVSLGALMEAAGGAVGRFCLGRYPGVKRVAVLCGKGNNGGDGMVAARVLAGAGCRVRVVLLGREDEVTGVTAEALGRLRAEAAGVVVESVVDEGGVEGLREELAAAELVVDAVVGTGFKPPLRGTAAGLRDLVNGLRVPVVAVDLPSGWDADATTQHADGTVGVKTNAGGGGDAGDARPEVQTHGAFRADAVVTFTAPKLAHVFGHLTAGVTFGPVVVAEIGSPARLVESGLGLTWTGSSKRIAEVPRNINSNKGMYGHVLLVAGIYGKSGAPSMAALAGLRAGAGLVTAAVPRSILTTVALVTPELMTVPLDEGPEGTASMANLEEGALGKLTKGIKVLAVGPGLGTEGEASGFARGLIERTAMPVVIDADGLNAYAGRAELLDGISGKGMGVGTARTVVLTPHPGEMARLIGGTVPEVEADRVGLARRFATEHGVTLVLKGWRTLVAHPDGRVAVNTTGNPGMAKGGSGDILTGVVAAMLAQFPDDVAEAVETAVYLHGLAADLAVARGDREEHTLLATDTVAHLGAAFRYRVRDGDGFTWVAGVNGTGYRKGEDR